MGDVSRSSITLSSASYASSLFPAVDETSASLIEAILSRISPLESEWKPFLQAYDEVFNEQGLDKQSDTVIYDLILKLGLQAGKNWRAKWENVKRTQHELALQPHGAQRVDQGVGRNETNLKTPINKAKVDYARNGRDTVTPGSESYGQPRLTREALDELQHAASPYKALQTPYAEQTRERTRAGTTPRVHFAHDGLPQYSRPHSDVFRTPDLSTPSRTAEEREEMLRQAVQIDRINLLGRMYDDWISRFFVLKRLDMHTALARDALLKRRSLTFWHERLLKHGELEERVNLAYKATLTRSCLRLWQQKAIKKQKTGWERQMSFAYRTITRKKERQISEAAFAAWREASLESRSSRFHRTCLLRHSLQKWLANAARLAELHSEATALQASHNDILLVNAFSRWKTNTILLVREHEVVEGVDIRLLGQAFQSWRTRLHHGRIADSFQASIVQKRAFTIWLRRKARNDALNLQAVSLSQAKDEDTLERAFHTWKIREHSRLLERAKSLRLVRVCFQSWRDRHQAITTKLESRALVHQRHNEAALLKSTLSNWVKKTKQQRKTFRLAASLSARLLLQRTFSEWKDQLANRQMDYRKSQVADTFFSQRHALRIWYRKMRWVKANKTIAAKESDTVKIYFHSWQDKTKKVQRFAILEEGIGAAIDQRVLSDALTTWTNKVIELRARAISVTHTREEQILRNSFSHWLAKSRQNIENLSLVDSFIEVQEEEFIRNKFTKWLLSTKRKIKLRKLLQDKLRDDERNLLAGVLDRWIDVYKERQLIDREMDIVRYRTYQSLGLALQKWKSQTMTLPAIRFDAQRQRRRFFSIWRDRLPERMNENHAIDHDRLRLLRATLTVWQEGTRAQIARRAANRFRAFAARSPLPPSSSTYRLPLPTSHAKVPYPASESRIDVIKSSSRIATPAHLRMRKIETNALHALGRQREGIPSSTAMPYMHSATQLRKEIGSSPSRQRVVGTSSTPSQGRIKASTSHVTLPTTPAARSRRESTLDPESIALPPSSTATGPSSSSSASPSFQPLSLPPVRQNAATSTTNLEQQQHQHQQQQQQQRPDDKIDSKHVRKKSKSRDAFEEGILKEMRERLAAAGLGDGVKSKNQ